PGARAPGAPSPASTRLTTTSAACGATAPRPWRAGSPRSSPPPTPWRPDVQIALLILVLVAGLIMLPFGLPGLWVMAGAVLLDAAVVPAHVVSLKLGVIITIVAGVAEVIEIALAGKF